MSVKLFFVIMFFVVTTGCCSVPYLHPNTVSRIAAEKKIPIKVTVIIPTVLESKTLYLDLPYNVWGADYVTDSTFDYKIGAVFKSAIQKSFSGIFKEVILIDDNTSYIPSGTQLIILLKSLEGKLEIFGNAENFWGGTDIAYKLMFKSPPPFIKTIYSCQIRGLDSFRSYEESSTSSAGTIIEEVACSYLMPGFSTLLTIANAPGSCFDYIELGSGRSLKEVVKGISTPFIVGFELLSNYHSSLRYAIIISLTNLSQEIRKNQAIMDYVENLNHASHHPHDASIPGD